MHVDVTYLALVVAGIVVIGVLVLVGFTIHRLADINAKKIVTIVIAIVLLLSALPPLVLAFLDSWS